ncbi:MAG: hypothetical protein WBZ01_01285 [Terriglobales bacterium]|jgi:hypothetical protein
MTPTTLFVLALLFMVVCFVVFRTIPVLRTYFLYRGKWLVNCPETLKTQAVDVAARTAAASSFLGGRTLRLDRCSRWPERQDCGQACLKQIAADPENCLLWNIVSNWYLGRSCVCCHKRFGVLHRLDHAPALMRKDHTTIEWDQIRPEQVPEIFSTSKPVCWNCHISATFRRVHPELVVDRKRTSAA